MSVDITPYRNIIHSLAPMVNQSTFNSAFDKRTRDVAKEVKFLLKMEVKRLAKPCVRSIDLRQKVEQPCSLYTYEGTQHYLHENGIFMFEKLVKKYGEYTFGVYEGILDFVEKEQKRLSMVKAPTEPQYESAIDIANAPYAIPCQALLNFPFRKEERLNYVIAVELFFQDGASAHANTIDVSVSGLKIRFKDPKALYNLREASFVHVVFRGMQKASKANKERGKYRVLGLSDKGAKTCIHLYRTDTTENEYLNDHIAALVEQYKRRYKVNLDNIEMALSSKIYEQNFANTNTSLPVFLGEDNQGQLGPLYMTLNGCTKRITDYWLNEKYQQMLGYMFSPERTRFLLSKILPKRDNTTTTVFCFHHIDKEKIYFYSAYIHELIEQPKLAETFLAYGARRVSWRIFNVCMQSVEPKNADIPTSLPDTVSKQVARANKPLTPRLKGRVAKIKGIALVTDVTNADIQTIYQRRQLCKPDVKLLKYFGHPRNKLPMVIDTYRHKQQDLRRQTRYIFRTPIVIEAKGMKIHGFTEDISISGLRLQLDQPFTKRMNANVAVTFPKLNALANGYDLSAVKYKVRGVKADKFVLHLQADEETSNTRKQFFKELIENNIDKLRALQFDERLPGMSLALRNLHARTSSQLCVYIEKKPNGFSPAMATSNNTESSIYKLLSDGVTDTPLVNVDWLFSDSKENDGFIMSTVSTLSNDSGPVSAEIFVCFDPNAIEGKDRITAKWDYQLRTLREKIGFIQQARNIGHFFSFSITINKALRPDTELLEHELHYLSQQAIHKAAHFEERMWDIAATLFFTDITHETLFRFQPKGRL